MNEDKSELDSIVGIQFLMQPSVLRFLGAAAFDWVVIIAAYILCSYFPNPFTYILALILIGARQHALNVLGHDGAHRMCSRNRKVNDILTNLLCFWPFMIGINSYRKFHFAHHRHSGKVGDPELVHKAYAAPQFDLPTTRSRILTYFIQDLFALNSSQLIVLIRLFKPVRKSDVFGPIAWWAVTILVLTYFNLLWTLIFWFAANYTFYWAFFRIRIWTEHIGTQDTHRYSTKAWQRFLFVPHNTYCHYEHHHYPAVPCWNLPKLRTLIPEPKIITFDELFRSFASAKPHGSGVPTH